ncbi:MAG: TROVE domain-containing protein [Atopobiaceae bacterium]|nr:TROVE domain-containing protein [Atopobiaceae bacterium]
MATLNNTVRGMASVRNTCGHAAYAMDDKTALAVMAMTTFYAEDKFYGDNTSRMMELVRKLIQCGMGEYVAQTAVWARTKGNLRTVSHVLAAIVAHECSGKSFVRPAVRAIASMRGDDGTELLAAHAALYDGGSKLPHALVRGVRDALEQMGPYQIAKYQSKTRAWKMRDTLRLTHPVPRDDETSMAMRACVAGTLAMPKGWETELSERGNTAEVWNELLAERRVGFMAQLRNLRNIIRSGADVAPVLRLLQDGDAVRTSRQLPFRFYSAWRELAAVGLANDAVTHALDAAMMVACANADRLPGRTAVMVDSSFSMRMCLSARSKVTCRDVAAVLAAMASHISNKAWVCSFDNCARMLLFTGTSVLADVQRVPAAGGWTDMGAAFDLLMASGFDADRVIVLSDSEVNSPLCETTRTIQCKLDAYREQVGHDVWCHAIDLMGYGTQQFLGPQVNVMGGWSEQVLHFLALAESGFGSLVEEIEAVNL